MREHRDREYDENLDEITDIAGRLKRNA
jgi:hypothetical protein